MVPSYHQKCFAALTVTLGNMLPEVITASAKGNGGQADAARVAGVLKPVSVRAYGTAGAIGLERWHQGCI